MDKIDFTGGAPAADKKAPRKPDLERDRFIVIGGGSCPGVGNDVIVLPPHVRITVPRFSADPLPKGAYLREYSLAVSVEATVGTVDELTELYRTALTDALQRLLHADVPGHQWERNERYQEWLKERGIDKGQVLKIDGPHGIVVSRENDLYSSRLEKRAELSRDDPIQSGLTEEEMAFCRDMLDLGLVGQFKNATARQIGLLFMKYADYQDKIRQQRDEIRRRREAAGLANTSTVQTLRRFKDAINGDYVIPFRIIPAGDPGPNRGGDGFIAEIDKRLDNRVLNCQGMEKFHDGPLGEPVGPSDAADEPTIVEDKKP